MSDFLVRRIDGSAWAPQLDCVGAIDAVDEWANENLYPVCEYVVVEVARAKVDGLPAKKREYFEITPDLDYYVRKIRKPATKGKKKRGRA